MISEVLFSFQLWKKGIEELSSRHMNGTTIKV